MDTTELLRLKNKAEEMEETYKAEGREEEATIAYEIQGLIDQLMAKEISR